MFNKITFSNITHYTFAMVIFIALLAVSLPIKAQQQSKPKLVKIALNDATNDATLLKLGEILNPDLFYIEDGFSGKAKHYAAYLPLDNTNKKRFFALTVTDTTYFCTSYGCPTYIYENMGGNKWKQALSFQANVAYYDLNTVKGRPDNIISVTLEQAQKKVNLWLWDGLTYKKAERK